MATSSLRPEAAARQRALAEVLESALAGAALQQVRGPALDGVVQLALYLGRPSAGPRKVLLDVWARAGVTAAWRTEQRRANRTPQGSFVMYLRKHVVGARLHSVRCFAGGLAFGWQRRSGGGSAEHIGWLVAVGQQLQWLDAKLRVRVAWPGRATAAAVEGLAGLVAGERAAVAASASASAEVSGEGLRLSDVERAARDRAEGKQERRDGQRVGSELSRALKRTRKRQARLVRALAGDLAQAEGAEALREQGEVLKCQLHKVPSGADHVRLPVTWDPPRQVDIALRRDLTPAANLARIFRRARGFARRRGEIAERHAQAAATLAALDALAADALAFDGRSELARDPRAADPSAADALAELWRRASALGVRGAQPRVAPALRRPGRSKTTQLPQGVQRWSTADGAEVLMGRSAKANDQLVTRLARGRDLWMHVRGRVGAHLLLRTQAGQPVSQDTLQRCAMLCAWASGVPRGDRVDVTWTEARHVRKAKGSAPGLVYVAEERTVYVAVEAEVIDGFRARRSARARHEG